MGESLFGSDMDEDRDLDSELEGANNKPCDGINDADMLPPNTFPASPNPRPPKRARPLSPDVFINSGPSGGPGNLFFLPQNPTPTHHQTEPFNTPDHYSPPFEAEKVFQLHPKYEFPQAGHIYQKNQPTIFHQMQTATSSAFPYAPFLNEAEWSLAEFLATSRLSKGSIDTFLKSSWVCFH